MQTAAGSIATSLRCVDAKKHHAATRPCRIHSRADQIVSRHRNDNGICSATIRQLLDTVDHILIAGPSAGLINSLMPNSLAVAMRWG